MLEVKNDYYTVGQVCVILNACPSKVYGLIHKGEITASRCGRMLLVTKDSITSFIERNVITV